MKKSKVADDEILPVIEGAELSKLRDNCSALIETLDKLRCGALSKIRRSRPALKYRGDSYMLSVDVGLRMNGEKWQGTTDGESWTSLQPTRDAAIRVALKAELTRVLKQIEDES